MMKKFEMDINTMGVDFFVKGRYSSSKEEPDSYQEGYSNFEIEDVEVFVDDQEVSAVLNDDAWEELYREIEENVSCEEDE